MSQLPYLDIWLAEYEKLKDEQIQRIGFRDNLLYVTLGVFGGIVSFALSSSSNYHALLVLPWACLILGWTYLVNDEKISAIGRYIRLTLVEKIQQKADTLDADSLLGWEIAHRSDHRRSRRKFTQLIIDEVTFVLSGIIALIAFWILVPKAALATYLLSGLELLLLIYLGWEINVYSNLEKTQSTP